MKHFDCYKCAHVIFDKEHEVEYNKTKDPHTIDYFLCNNSELKDILAAKFNTYGGIPIGKACWTCEGNYYVETDSNILDYII